MRAGKKSIATGIASALVCVAAAPLAMPVAQAGASFAQVLEPRATVKLNMDDQHVIKEFTLDAPETPKKAEEADLRIGAKLPADFPLQQFPEEATKKVPQVKEHRFFVQDNRIFVVDPTRTIAEIIPRDEQ